MPAALPLPAVPGARALRVLALPLPLALALALTGCSQQTGTTVAVTADDRSCQAAQTELAAGRYTFQVTNTGSKTTEVYVYEAVGGKAGAKVDEVEGIGPGTSRSLTVRLDAGRYQLQCKPGGTTVGSVDLTVS